MVSSSSSESCSGILHHFTSTLSNLKQQTIDWMACLKCIAMISAFVSHVLAQDTCISRKTAHSHSDIVVNLKHLLLIASQIGWQPFQTTQNLHVMKIYDVVVRTYTQADTTLLHSLHSVLNLEEFALW
jgi:hypothetical protein